VSGVFRFWLRHYFHGMLDLTFDSDGRSAFIWCTRCQTGTYGKPGPVT
jgi:hypothetical protein